MAHTRVGAAKFYYDLGKKASENGDANGVVRWYGKALEEPALDPIDKLHIHYDLANSYLKLGMHGEAFQEISHCELLDAKLLLTIHSPNPSSSLAIFDSVAVKKIPELWSDTLNQALNTRHFSLADYINLYLARLADYQEERRQWQASPEAATWTHKTTALVMMLSRLAELYYHEKEYDQAAECLQESKALLQASKTEEMKGFVWYRYAYDVYKGRHLVLYGLIKFAICNSVEIKDYQAAKETLDIALTFLQATDHEDWKLYLKALRARGLTHLTLRKNKQAIADFETLMQLDKSQMSAEDFHLLSRAYGAEPGALTACLEALAIHPNYMPAQLQQALLSKAEEKPYALCQVMENAYKQGIRNHEAIVVHAATELEKIVKNTPHAWLLQWVRLRNFEHAFRCFTTPPLDHIDAACEAFGEYYGNTLRGLYYLNEPGILGAGVIKVTEATECFVAAIHAYARAGIRDWGMQRALLRLEENCTPEAATLGGCYEALYDGFAGCNQDKLFYLKACAAYARAERPDAIQTIGRKRVTQLCRAIEDQAKRRENNDTLQARLAELEEFALHDSETCKRLGESYELLSLTFPLEERFFQHGCTTYLALADEGRTRVSQLRRRRGDRLHEVGAVLVRGLFPTAESIEKQNAIFEQAITYDSYRSAAELAKKSRDPVIIIRYIERAVGCLEKRVDKEGEPLDVQHTTSIKNMVATLDIIATNDPGAYARLVTGIFSFLIKHQAGEVLEEVVARPPVQALIHAAMEPRSEQRKYRELYFTAQLVYCLPRMTKAHKQALQDCMHRYSSQLALCVGRALALQPKHSILAESFLAELYQQKGMSSAALQSTLRSEIQTYFHQQLHDMKAAEKLFKLMEPLLAEDEEDMETMMDALPDNAFADWVKAELFATLALRKKDAHAHDATREAVRAYSLYGKIFQQNEPRIDLNRNQIPKLDAAFPGLALQLSPAVRQAAMRAAEPQPVAAAVQRASSPVFGAPPVTDLERDQHVVAPLSEPAQQVYMNKI